MTVKVRNKESQMWLTSYQIRGNYSEATWTDFEDQAYEFRDMREVRKAFSALSFWPALELEYKKIPKPKIVPVVLPAEIWVMGYHTFNQLGSICHVSHGDLFYATEAECQHAIDTMKGWIGMGDRSKYRPILLVSKKE